MSQQEKQVFNWQYYIRIDPILFILLVVICAMGLITLYSAGRQDMDLVAAQAMRMLLGFILMIIIAYLPPQFLKTMTPIAYVIGVILLLLIFYKGIEVNGSRRWLNIGISRFQPSELMKLIIPMAVAWYLDKFKLPPSYWHLIIALLICLIPGLAILKQPDLGTALMVIFVGLCVIFLAGLSIKFIISALIIVMAILPIFWQYGMKTYQKQRVLTLLNPESDPLGAGYHIIQSKIAIGSGNIYGKGYLNGTQANLQFLPESTTDFIYAVAAEEFGLIIMSMLIFTYFLVIIRCFNIANKGSDNFARLLGGSLTMNFFFCVFVNAGMVSGILPVVGVPLPLISYGGSSIVTLFVAFGILMNIHANAVVKKKDKYTDL